MCFNYKLSILSTLTHYSAILFIIKSKMYTNKSLLYSTVFWTLTTGVIEPLEGIIHYNFYKSSKININLKKLLLHALYLQPAFSIIPYIYMQIDTPVKNNLLLTLLTLHYIYWTNDFELGIIKEKYTNLFKPSHNIYIKGSSSMGISQTILTFLPGLFLSYKIKLYRKIVILNIALVILIKFIYHQEFVASLWCFTVSFQLWYVIYLTG